MKCQFCVDDKALKAFISLNKKSVNFFVDHIVLRNSMTIFCWSHSLKKSYFLTVTTFSFEYKVAGISEVACVYSYDLDLPLV